MRWNLLLPVRDGMIIFEITFLLPFVISMMIGFVGHASQPTNTIVSCNSSGSNMYDYVSYYFISNTASEELLNPSDINVLITKPVDKPDNTTCTVSVRAVDMFKRTGSGVLCSA